MPSFGYEAEYDNNVQELATYLFTKGVTRDDNIHNYTCDCPGCRYTPDPYYPSTVFLYRVKSDSSCGGEVISRPFNDLVEGREAMDLLQEATLETDAAPGYTAGFHVHVGIDGVEHQRQENLQRALWAFTLWEPTVELIARGRFPILRDQNRRVRRSIHPYLLNFLDGDDAALNDYYNLPTWANTFRRVVELEESSLQDLMAHIYSYHYDSDRHTNLNICTGKGTWEYRIYNSTRSAWRMQGFVETSIALLDPHVVNELIDAHPGTTRRSTEWQLRTFLRCIKEAGHPHENIERQIRFVNEEKATDEAFNLPI